jgi:rare lipoprotein A (peptidoglycan hydrolase)
VISGFAERAILLAIVVVVALVAVLYPQRRKPHPAATLPIPIPAPDGKWYNAIAGAHGGAAPGKRSGCGQIVRKEDLGVAYAGLPCGAKIFVAYGKTVVLTEVVDHGPYVPGRAFDFTPALARKLGLHGTQHVRWRFAQPG